MEEKTVENLWRLEVSNPQESTDWKPLWSFGTDQFSMFQELAESLNQINAPVQLRIARLTDETMIGSLKG
jgi:hypothetical protein